MGKLGGCAPPPHTYANTPTPLLSATPSPHLSASLPHPQHRGGQGWAQRALQGIFSCLVTVTITLAPSPSHAYSHSHSHTHAHPHSSGLEESAPAPPVGNSHSHASLDAPAPALPVGNSHSHPSLDDLAPAPPVGNCPDCVGEVNGVLNACQLGSLSCVSTLSDDAAHFVAPWEYEGSRDAAIQLLEDVATGETLPRVHAGSHRGGEGACQTIVYFQFNTNTSIILNR